MREMVHVATYRAAKEAVSSMFSPNRGFIASFLALAISTFSAFGGIVPSDDFNDGIDRTDPNFVTASLLVMSPGVFFSLFEGGVK